jgi:RNA polymerase sigma-70 factor (ECF subfamily)
MPAGSATGRQGVPATAAVLRQAPDERLVALVRDGSPAAFEEISARYRRRLHAYCMRLVGPAHAEDVVQQALLRAYLSLRRGDLRHVALRAWLYKIARNCAIDLLRSRPPEHEELDLEFDGVPQPPRLVEQKEEIGTLVSALQGLPEGQRRALTLRELEGRSYSEISEELGQTGPCVRQLIFRARETLRSGLGALVPAGFLRRFIGSQPPVVEAHHGAMAAKLSSGGGLEAVGAMAAATITLLASTAGSPPAPAHADRPVAPLVGPLHSSASGAPATERGTGAGSSKLAVRTAAMPHDGSSLTGGAGVAVSDRSYSVAAPAAERSSTGRGEARPEDEPSVSAAGQDSAESDTTPEAGLGSGGAGTTGPGGATGPSGPADTGEPTGSAPPPGEPAGDDDSGGITLELLTGELGS